MKADKLRTYSERLRAIALELSSELPSCDTDQRKEIEHVVSDTLKAKGRLSTLANRLDPKPLDGVA